MSYCLLDTVLFLRIEMKDSPPLCPLDAQSLRDVVNQNSMFSLTYEFFISNVLEK